MLADLDQDVLRGCGGSERRRGDEQGREADAECTNAALSDMLLEWGRTDHQSLRVKPAVSAMRAAED
jgi:hypothetical protein